MTSALWRDAAPTQSATRRAPPSPAAWRILSFVFAAALILAWEIAAQLRFVSPVFLPAPSAAWESLLFNLGNGALLPKIAGTVRHMFFGWLVATVVAVALGALIGSSRAARTAFTPTLEFLRPLPVSAVIPVAIAAFGMSEQMAIFVIAFGTIWPMLLATVHGFSAVNPRLYEVARLLGLSRPAVVAKIALPSALPDILAGMRISITVALILAIVCEIVAGIDGLGQWVLLSARMYRAPDLYAGVILLGVIGYVSSVTISALEHRLLAWRNQAR